MEEGEKDKGGRPTKYDPSFNEQAYKLSLAGFTDKQMADFFEVAESTINLWKIKFPKFSESLRKGKEIADSEVAQKLFQRAIGYQYTESKTENDPNQGIIKTTQTTKTVVPDPTAQIFWLKNRQPDKWRDSKNIDHTTGGEALVLNEEDRKARIAALKKKMNESDE